MKVQHPQVFQRTDRKGSYWFFRYWHEELLPDGSIKTTRRFRTLGPSNGQDALTRAAAEARRDSILGGLDVIPPTPVAVPQPPPAEPGAILFGNLAEMWRRDYVENSKIRLAEPTRIKYRTRLGFHILPRWSGFVLTRCGPKRSWTGCTPNALP